MNQPKFCTYVHCRPNGAPFYTGKGVLGRARDFAPSRRTLHHQNIVNKYGRDNIRICVFLCRDEADAFVSEIALIKEIRDGGHKLINLTDGGEGVTGRKPTEAQLAGLAKGRGANHFHNMLAESRQRVLNGLAAGRIKAKTSTAFLAHLGRLPAIGAEALHKERPITCVECSREVITRSAKAKCCSRLCEQRSRRRRLKNEGN